MGHSFLDEIGDMQLTLKPKFLRAIQEELKFKELVQPKLKKLMFDYWLATHKNLESMVKEKSFARIFTTG